MRSFLTALAIIIGTAAVITVIGIGSSAEKALEASIDDLGPRTLSIFPSQRKRGGISSGYNPLVIKDAEALARNNEHNWRISPTITRNRQIKFGNANINERVGAYLPIHFNVRGYDLEHGRRAAEYVHKIRGKWFDITNEEIELLVEACKYHSDGLVEGDITIQTCWDSDRLELGRVGIKPLPERMCTEFAKRQDVIEEAYERSIIK